MAIFAVTTNIPTHSGFLWFFAECDCETIDEVDEALAEDGFLKCVKIEIDRTTMNKPVKRIIGRDDRIVGVAGIVTIAPSSDRFEDATLEASVQA